MSDAEGGRLLDVLEEARTLGFLGRGSIERQYEHARDLALAIGVFRGRMLDLGSGGGLPGLVLFDLWAEATGALLDAQQRRCDFLRRATSALGLSERVEVRCGRAEMLARDPALRATFDLVVSRSFGPPAVTAECAVGFLRRGGDLVVTEPPGPQQLRWDPDGLDELGLDAPVPLRVGETGAVRIALGADVADRWPRRDGAPAKRPLW